MQPEQWEVGGKDPDSISQVLKVFQGLLKVFCTTHPEVVMSLKIILFTNQIKFYL